MSFTPFSGENFYTTPQIAHLSPFSVTLPESNPLTTLSSILLSHQHPAAARTHVGRHLPPGEPKHQRRTTGRPTFPSLKRGRASPKHAVDAGMVQASSWNQNNLLHAFIHACGQKESIETASGCFLSLTFPNPVSVLAVENLSTAGWNSTVDGWPGFAAPVLFRGAMK